MPYILSVLNAGGCRGKQRLEVGGSKSRDGVPTCRSVPPRAVRERGVRRATTAVTARDVEESSAVVVKPRVQESQRGLALALPRGIQQRDDTSEDGGRRARAGEQRVSSLIDNCEVSSLSSDIGKASVGGVEIRRVSVADRVQIGAHGLALPRRSCVKRAESTARKAHGRLGAHAARSADRGDVGTRTGERRLEVRRIIRVPHASIARARVAGREYDAHAPRTKLHKQVADLQGILLGDGLLVFSVGRRQSLGQVRIILVEEVRQELEVRLIG